MYVDWKINILRYKRMSANVLTYYPVRPSARRVATKFLHSGRGAWQRWHTGPPGKGVCIGLTALSVRIYVTETAMSAKRRQYYAFPFQILDLNLTLINYRLKWHKIRFGRRLKKIGYAYNQPIFEIQLARGSQRSLVWCSVRSIHQMFNTHVLWY